MEEKLCYSSAPLFFFVEGQSSLSNPVCVCMCVCVLAHECACMLMNLPACASTMKYNRISKTV